MTDTEHHPLDPGAPSRLRALLADDTRHLYAGHRVNEHLVPLDSRGQADLQQLLERETDARANAEKLAEKCATLRAERDVYHGQADELAAKLQATLRTLTTAQTRITELESDLEHARGRVFGLTLGDQG